MRVARLLVPAALAALAVACESSEPQPDSTTEEVVVEMEETEEVLEDAVEEEETTDDPAAGWSVEPEADEVLRAAGELLSRAQRFSFRAEVVAEEVLHSGAKIDQSHEAVVHVRRPDGLRVERFDAGRERRICYDGKSAALLDVGTNLYVLNEDPPPDIDTLLDYIVDKLNVSIPLADVVVADPYESLRGPALGGVHLGSALVRGTTCHHLGFGDGNIEWQVWVHAEGPPLIRKAVINYRDEPGAPRWEAHISDWNLEDTLPAAEFTFQPPAGSHRIQVWKPGALDEEVGDESEEENTDEDE